MLQVQSEFPFPGSLALFEGLRWRVLQHIGDQALIMREGLSASLSRRAPIEDLVDPADADVNALLSVQDIDRATQRIALFTARLLREANDIALRDLGSQLAHHAKVGRIPRYQDNSHLSRIMRALGWRKDGYTGEGLDRSPRYIRVATPAKAA